MKFAKVVASMAILAANHANAFGVASFTDNSNLAGFDGAAMSITQDYYEQQKVEAFMRKIEGGKRNDLLFEVENAQRFIGNGSQAVGYGATSLELEDLKEFVCDGHGASRHT